MSRYIKISNRLIIGEALAESEEKLEVKLIIRNQ